MAIIITASTNYTLGAGEDNLQLTGSADVNGTGNAGNNFLTGNDGANVLIGGAGGDFLLGGAGDDILIGNVDSVTADAEADYLNGEDGNDIIYLTGRDMTDSGAGADTYWVMTGRNNHIWDTGTDTSVDVVKTYTSVTMGSFNFDTSKPYAMIYDGIERVELQGTANLSAVGGLGNETLIGNSGNNLLDGGGDGFGRRFRNLGQGVGQGQQIEQQLQTGLGAARGMAAVGIDGDLQRPAETREGAAADRGARQIGRAHV